MDVHPTKNGMKIGIDPIDPYPNVNSFFSLHFVPSSQREFFENAPHSINDGPLAARIPGCTEAARRSQGTPLNEDQNCIILGVASPFFWADHDKASFCWLYKSGIKVVYLRINMN